MPRVNYVPTNLPDNPEDDARRRALADALLRPPAQTGGGGGGGGGPGKITHPLQGVAHVMNQVVDGALEANQRAEAQRGEQMGMALALRAMGDGKITPPTFGGAPAPGGGGAGGGGSEARPTSFNAKAVPAFVTAAGDKYGISPDFMTKTAWIESKGNPNAVSSTGATGLYQFTRGTAKQFGLADRNDPVASADAAARLAASNRDILQGRLGRAPTDAELYLAHQQGAGGAAGLLANPNARAGDIVGDKAVRVNGGRPDMTAGEFSRMWTGKFDGLQRRADLPVKGGTPAEMASRLPADAQGFPLVPGPQSAAPQDGMLQRLPYTPDPNANPADMVQRLPYSPDPNADPRAMYQPAAGGSPLLGNAVESSAGSMTARTEPSGPVVDLSGTPWTGEADMPVTGTFPAPPIAAETPISAGPDPSASPLLGNTLEQAARVLDARMAGAPEPAGPPMPPAANPGDPSGIASGALAFDPRNLPLPANDPAQAAPQMPQAVASPPGQAQRAAPSPVQEALGKALQNAPLPPVRPPEFAASELPAQGARPVSVPEAPQASATPQALGRALMSYDSANSRDAGAGDFARGNMQAIASLLSGPNPIQASPAQQAMGRALSGRPANDAGPASTASTGAPIQVAQAGGGPLPITPQAAPQGYGPQPSGGGFLESLFGGGRPQQPTAAMISQMSQEEARNRALFDPYVPKEIKARILDQAYPEATTFDLGDHVGVRDKYGRMLYSLPKTKAADFGTVGKDAYGNDIQGFRNYSDQSVRVPQVPGSSASAPPVDMQGRPIPQGVDPKVVREAQSKDYAAGTVAVPSSQVAELRKEVFQTQGYKNYSQAVPVYRTMVDAAGRNTRAADLNLVYGLAKLYDPGSVVREGEMVMVNNTQGLPDRVVGMINSLNGGAALSPDARARLMTEAHSRMKAYEDEYANTTTHYGGIAKRNRMNVEDVIPSFAPVQPWIPPQAQSGSAGGAAAAPASPKSQADFDALPKGSTYRDPDDGKLYRKN